MRKLKLTKKLVSLFVLSIINNLGYAESIKVIPNEYVVKLKKQADSKQISSTMAAQIADRLGNDTVLLKPFGESKIAQDYLAIKAVEYSSSMDQFCKEGIKNNLFENCSPNFLVQTQRLPNDPRMSQLWGMSNIEAPSAWDITTGSAQVVIAVIDTGVDYNHHDLVANMWINTAEIPNNGIDDDSNGYIDDRHGINAINNSGNPMDDNDHGTHCAGTIAGVGNNGVGVAGVSWNSKIMALKFLTAQGFGSIADAIKTINYMVVMKNRGVNIKVSSNSWGGGGFS